MLLYLHPPSLVVLRVQSRTRELRALPDDLLDSIKEISFCRNFSSGSNSKHTSLDYQLGPYFVAQKAYLGSD
jgi:hypothetical protein